MNINFDIFLEQIPLVLSIIVTLIFIAGTFPELVDVIAFPFTLVYKLFLWLRGLVKQMLTFNKINVVPGQYEQNRLKELVVQYAHIKSKIQCVPSYPLALDINSILLNELKNHSHIPLKQIQISSIDGRRLIISISSTEPKNYDKLILLIHKSLCAFFIPLYKYFVFEYQIIEYNTGVHPMCISSIKETKLLSYE